MISYESRVSKMKKQGDETLQLRLAKQYAMNLKKKVADAKSLEEKIKLESAAKEAENVVRLLRRNIFDLEDMLLISEAKERAINSEYH